MSNLRLDPEEFIKLAKKVLSAASSETTYRRIMSACYYAPKILAWDYADKIIKKSLLEIARENNEETDDWGFSYLIANEFSSAKPYLDFLFDSRVAADHNLATMFPGTWRITSCNKQEAENAIRSCEELVLEIKKKFQ